ncbi:hypothetical protein KKC1_26690 [Calderihabitans maritimus]|uniref:Uncharacterized protein n=1 Tax=Calderihabitans maritimus TaxID=1246530 RepID=A0A1Z5HVV7_9FIRM|nr:hypothetical protein KKC1_26690 [Calderihabitans maritimus]
MPAQGTAEENRNPKMAYFVGRLFFLLGRKNF